MNPTIGLDRKKLFIISGISILNTLENKLSELENQLIFIDNKNDKKMSRLTNKIGQLTSSSIIVRFSALIYTNYFSSFRIR